MRNFVSIFFSPLMFVIKDSDNRVPSFAQISCNVPLYLEQICIRALEKDPRNRFESAKAMKKALEHYLDTFKNEDITSEKDKNKSSSHTSLPNIKYSHITHEEIVRTPACIERVPENPTLLRPVAYTNHSNLASSIQKMSTYTGNAPISQAHMMKPKPAPVPNRQNEAIQLETTKLRSGRHPEDDEPTQLDRKINPIKSSDENLDSNPRSAKPLSRETKRYTPEPKRSMQQEPIYSRTIKPGPVPRESNGESMRQESTYRGAIKPGPVPRDSCKPGPVPKETRKPEPVPGESTTTDIISDDVSTVVSQDTIKKFNPISPSDERQQNSKEQSTKNRERRPDSFGYLINKKAENNDPVTLFDLVLWGTIILALLTICILMLVGII